jgi:hypothetical protein
VGDGYRGHVQLGERHGWMVVGAVSSEYWVMDGGEGRGTQWLRGVLQIHKHMNVVLRAKGLLK